MTQGRIVQISASRGGLPKYAVPEGTVNELGLEGDAQAHPMIHGGRRQALLLVTMEGLEELNGLGYVLYPGALGENLTVEGLDRRAMRLGQRYRAGAAIIELTKMRAPCHQLNVYGSGIQQQLFDKQVKKGDWTSPLWGLGGFYAAVVRSGRIRPRDIIALVD